LLRGGCWAGQSSRKLLPKLACLARREAHCGRDNSQRRESTAMMENQEQRRSPVYCTYCGTPFPTTEQWRTSGPIQCETCGGTQYLGARYQQQRSYVIEVICPNRKCGEWAHVNKLEREGKAKVGCQACGEQIQIQTDNLGKLKGVSLLKKSALTSKHWMAFMAATFLLGLLLGLVFQSAPPPPASANMGLSESPPPAQADDGTSAQDDAQTGESRPSPVPSVSVTGGQLQ
jgi:hypothetical protein